MKKTLIALMAMAGVAMASTTVSPVLTLPTGADSVVSLESYITGNAFTVAVTLSYNDIKTALLANNGDGYQLINVGTDSGSVTTGSRLGMTICYSNNSGIRGTWNEVTWNGYAPDGFQVGMDLGTLDNLPWDTATQASLVMTYANSTGTTGVLTLADANNNVVAQMGGVFCTALKSGSFDPNSLSLHSFVESAYVYNTGMTAAEAKALGAALVPEPTTATLSLLALAGLAARRRRK